LDAGTPRLDMYIHSNPTQGIKKCLEEQLGKKIKNKK
jgi:hypothetical protein